MKSRWVASGMRRRSSASWARLRMVGIRSRARETISAAVGVFDAVARVMPRPPLEFAGAIQPAIGETRKQLAPPKPARYLRDKTREDVMRVGWAALPLVLAAASAALAADPYKITALMSLTGQGAFIGKGEQQALQIEQKVINAAGGIKARPLEFEFQDDQTNPQVAVQLASEILAQKPQVMIG